MVSLPVWDKMTWWPQFYEHIIKHQTSNWSKNYQTSKKIIVNNLLSSFLSPRYLLESSWGVLSGRAYKDLHKRFTLSLC